MNGRGRAPTAASAEAVRPAERERRPPLFTRVTRALFAPRSIKAKLNRILLVSLVVVLVVLGFLIAGRVAEYRTAADTSRIATVTLSVQELVHAMQKERGLTNGLLGGGQYYRPSVLAQRMQTDAALVALNGILDDPAYAGAPVSEVRGALQRLAELTTVRNDVDSRQAQASVVFDFYTGTTRALNSLALGLDQSDDPALRSGLQALYALGEAKDYMDWERGLLNGVFAAGSFGQGQYQRFAEIRAHKQAALDEFGTHATPAQRQAVDAALNSKVATRSTESEKVALDSVTGDVTQQVDAQSHWWNQMTLVINDLRKAQRAIGADLTARAGELQDAALRALLAYVAAAALAVAVLVALVIGAARSIIGPLSTLAADADDVSMYRLPDAVATLENSTENQVKMPKPVPITVADHAGTEIKQMARALGRLQDTALTLAGEQAVIRRNTTVSLANLGRRNQNLVRRQLGLISDFEREELDSGTLANMFELDHLATRMRRNAESLLVLVGESGPRPWSEPLPITDVVRAALSEVEDYRRVSLKRIDDVNIVGSVVTEVAHMLAEVIENGLSFSPPDVEVEIYGRSTGDRYTIAVVDHGAGMSAEALATANGRLKDEENFLVAPTRFLGHYVVGRLSRKLGVDVTLARGPITGITARLVLPSILIANQPEPARPTRSETRPAPVAAPPAQWTADPRRQPPAAPSNGAFVPQQAPARLSAEQRPAQAPETRPFPAVQEPRVRVDVSSERTRNGLVKRQARPAPPTGRAATHARPPAETPANDRSPADTGAMLSAFRTGHERGAHAGGRGRETPPPPFDPPPPLESPSPLNPPPPVPAPPFEAMAPEPGQPAPAPQPTTDLFEPPRDEADQPPREKD